MATAPSLPPISSLPDADEATVTSILDTLFEPSSELRAIAVPAIQRRRRFVANPDVLADRPDDDTAFTTYASLIRYVGSLLQQLAVYSASPASPSSSASREKLHDILGSHPRLGEKKVDSAQSRAEQAQLNTGGAADEAERLAALNAEYEEKFPGLRYVVFVNGRSRDVVMEDMRRRIDRGDIRAEEKEAISAMVDIAMDRAKKLGSDS
ncbi:Oxo-4-hydroxy-4-carboxy-5-ureidoimidazoline decarboxylase [Xylaria bambusicola]|uniref:Oxo-4-hydroxy-4-carboxy-5-ureidoimidazoline decarboxylase n=1 Tax=Xylaria bambusicola TaxID=326684 RepID=UPI00200872FB|nr:Oxo-4-hydroxy-4-carboxy-5-ureidoimidazoline decarboxylase [Xylaria bambusicola]KAI0512816.1 Oxo-4-hydroxy-4-carboxy-5-ureidoimidazoline decarboxylase [Xylaria bambusicola]